MREQRIIFKLLDTAEIGVTLGPNFMMSPQKSLSVVFGAGAREMGSEGLTNCDFCSIQDRCRFTKTRDSRKTYPCRFRRPRTRGQPDQGFPARRTSMTRMDSLFET